MSFNKLLDGFTRLDLPHPSQKQQEQLQAYAELLLKWNKAINLIGRSTADDIYTRHILDSVQLLPHLSHAKHILDVGSGGGLPSIVMAILSGAHVTACERNGKKANFLKNVRRNLGLEKSFNVTQEDIREHTVNQKYDVITARAFAKVDEILEMTKNVISPTGRYVLLKGETAEDEILVAKQNYNMTTKSVSSITLPKGKIVQIEISQPTVSHETDTIYNSIS